MGAYIDKHFGPMGGFATRRHTNEFVTVLPYSDLAEAENILQDFVEDFRQRGIQDIGAGTRRQSPDDGCIEFAIRAGVAEGQLLVEIDDVIDAALQRQREIARWRCDGRR